MAYSRDPVSVLFDAGARRLLERAYARPGVWAGTRLADPAPRHLAWLRLRGINWRGPDNASARAGAGLNARDRWTRGFVRALYYQHRWYSGSRGQGWRHQARRAPRTAGALQVEIGRRLPGRGVLPGGRAVRVRLARGGQAKLGAVRKLPERGRIYDDRGVPAARWSDPNARDW